ncbi:hypothetical protein AALP_AA7G217300 [Arabis alpina]|uniref:Uncharacterized protein n=1 Tax=Arabis alpina TaxID=50452 RepID=A0A087GJQ2_ARAAL|nr:hypothetical protein AALP_AA7G217300 [Arabis alpina]
MTMMTMVRRIASRSYGFRSGGRDLASRSYSTAPSGGSNFSFSTVESVKSGREYVVACSKVLFTCSAFATGYALGPYVRPLENEELKEYVLEKEIDLLTIRRLLEIAQMNLVLQEIIEEAEHKIASGGRT